MSNGDSTPVGSLAEGIAGALKTSPGFFGLIFTVAIIVLGSMVMVWGVVQQNVENEKARAAERAAASATHDRTYQDLLDCWKGRVPPPKGVDLQLPNAALIRYASSNPPKKPPRK